MIVIAIATASRSRSDKLYSRLKKELCDPDAIMASFQYPAYKAARILGWDGKFDLRGRKLVATIYNAGEEYDKDRCIKKMEDLLVHSKRRAVIISDVKSKKQIDMLKSVAGIKLIVCSDNESQCDGLITVYTGDGDIDDIVPRIMKKVNEITERK
ncbi:MAG: hypothetical protein PHX79_06860 [Sphaerochaetaceae bacterium]|nr:hypothetical protein [Sphaerochaetaceae bacterium]